MTKKEILIVGAGPVGLTAAIELRRRGFAPRIIDKKSGPVAESRALAVNPRSLAILAPSGLSERMVAAGFPLRTAYFRGPKKLLFRLDLSALPKPYDFMLTLPQNRTEELMAARLAEMGLTVEWQTELRALEQSYDGIQVEIADGAGRLESAQPDLVIGADGAHSTVRHAIGQAFKGSAYEEKFGLADVEIETGLPLDGVIIFDCSPRLLAVFPIGGKRARLISDHEDLMAHLPPEIRVAQVHWETGFRISHRLVDRYQEGRVFLAGDAAHIHSPAGGRGMNLGIEDAAWLAWLIETGQTDRYSEDRRPVAKKVIDTVDPATRFVASDKPLHRFLRRHVIPPLASLAVVQRRMLPNLAASNTPFPPWLAR